MFRLWFFVVAALLLGGCGGKGGSGGGGSQTQDFSALVDFGNQQTGSFTLELQGTEVSGSLVCNDPPATVQASRGQAPILPAGSYSIAGTFTAPKSFTVTGSIPDPTRQFTITGEFPTATEAGSYTLTIDGEETTGQFPPLGQPKPVIVIDPDSVPVAQGSAPSFDVEVTNAPTGSLRYRWFIAAPAAYIVEQATPNQQGQDIETDQHTVKVQTGMADSGKLKLHVHVYSIGEDSVKRFIGEAESELQFEDIQVLIPTWVQEVNPSPFDPSQNIEAYFWDFPVIAGAKDYVITIKTAGGVVSQVYRMFQSSVANTAITDIPYLSGNHAVPPTIPVQEELSGVVRMNFIRRGNTIRMLVVWGNGFDPNIYRNNTPTSVVVHY